MMCKFRGWKATMILAVSVAMWGLRPAEALPSMESVEAAASASSIALNTGEVLWHGAKNGIVLMSVGNGVAGAIAVNNTLLADDESLEKDERDARSAGRAASYVGGIAMGVSSMFVVAGNAAGIAFGTTAVLVAAPAAVAVAAGVGTWGAVRLVQWMWN